MLPGTLLSKPGAAFDITLMHAMAGDSTVALIRIRNTDVAKINITFIKNGPYCDGSHNAAGFDGTLAN